MPDLNSSPAVSRRTFLAAGSVAGAALIHPFSQAARAQIAADTDLVQTSGYAARGRGAALYVRDSVVDAAYVAANRRTAFISADGRGFRLSLDQTITPFMFGAAGSINYDGVNPNLTTDDTVALQAFFDFCQQNRVESANWGGVFGVTAELKLGGQAFGDVATQYSHTETIDFAGAIVLVVKSNMRGAVLRVRTRRSATYGPITITSNHENVVYANRLFDFGIMVEDHAMFQVFSTVQVYQARIAGVLVRTRYLEDALEGGSAVTMYSNTYHNSFESCHFEHCGSGNLFGAKGALTSTFDSKRQEGAAESTSQLTSLRADTLPPELVENHAIPILVRFGGQLYPLKSLVRSTGFIKVYPWVDLTSPAAGTLEYVFGGGFVTEGGDTAITTGKISSMNCAAGLVLGSLYNGYYTGTFQSCGIGVLIGTGPDQVALGGALKGYFEANQFDVVWNAVNFNVDGYFTIEAKHTLARSKIRNLNDPRRADNLMMTFPIWGLQINDAHLGWQFVENGGDGKGNWTSVFLDFNRPNAIVVPLHSNNPAISVGADKSSLFLHGYRARTVQITGTGANKQPTGTLTVTPPTGFKLNRGAVNAAATFSGFTGPVTVQVEIDPSDSTNFIVSVLGGRVERAAAQTDSTAADVAALRADLNALLGKLRAAGIIAS